MGIMPRKLAATKQSPLPRSVEECSLRCASPAVSNASTSRQENPEGEGAWAGLAAPPGGGAGLELRRPQRKGHNLPAVCPLGQLLVHLQQGAGAEFSEIKLSCSVAFLKWFKKPFDCLCLSISVCETMMTWCLLFSRLPELQKEKANSDSSLRISTTSYWSKCCQGRGVGLVWGKESVRRASLSGKVRSRFNRRCGGVLLQAFRTEHA